MREILRLRTAQRLTLTPDGPCPARLYGGASVEAPLKRPYKESVLRVVSVRKAERPFIPRLKPGAFWPQFCKVYTAPTRVRAQTWEGMFE